MNSASGAGLSHQRANWCSVNCGVVEGKIEEDMCGLDDN